MNFSALAFAALAAAPADDSAWSAYARQCTDAVKSGKLWMGKLPCHEAVKEAEAFGDRGERMVVSLVHLGEYYQAENRLDQAEQTLKRAVGLLEAKFGANSPHLAFVGVRIYNLALVYLQTKQFAQAEKMFDEAEVIFRRGLEQEEKRTRSPSPEKGRLLLALADIERHRGQLERAEEHLRQAVIQARSTTGVKSLEYAQVLAALAAVLHERGQREEARKLHEEAQQIVKESPR